MGNATRLGALALLLMGLGACAEDAADQSPDGNGGGGAGNQAPAGGTSNSGSDRGSGMAPDLSADEGALLTAINGARAQHGLGAYRADAVLVCAARRHAADVGPTGRCDHSGTDGSSFAQRASECGGGARAEIIACGQRTPESAVEAWLGSKAGHREAVLNARYTDVGIAMVDNFWVGVLR